MQRAALPVLTAVLALLLLALWGGDGGDAGPAPVRDELSLWTAFEPDEVTQVRFIDKEPEGVRLAREGGEWTVTQADGTTGSARIERARGLVAALASLHSTRVIGGDPIDYGLGSSALQVQATLVDGSTRALHIGDPLTVGDGHYVLVDNTVHVAPSLPLALLSGDPLDLLEEAP